MAGPADRPSHPHPPRRRLCYVDEHVALVAERVGVVTLDLLLDEAMLRLHAENARSRSSKHLDATYVTLYESSINHTCIADGVIRADWKTSTTSTPPSPTSRTGWSPPTPASRSRPAGPRPRSARRPRPAGATGRQHPKPASPLSPPDPPVVHTTHDTLPGRTRSPASNPHRRRRPRGPGPTSRHWCGQTGPHIKVTPVIDLTQPVTLDRYVVGDRLRTRMTLRHPTCVFPWCTRPARACDADHITPFTTADQPRRQPRPLLPATSPPQNQNRLDLPDPRPRHLALDRPPRPHLPPQHNGSVLPAARAVGSAEGDARAMSWLSLPRR